MDLVHDRGSMDLVHESGPWTRSKEGVHGPLVHVLSSPSSPIFSWGPVYPTKKRTPCENFRVHVLKQLSIEIF